MDTKKLKENSLDTQEAKNYLAKVAIAEKIRQKEAELNELIAEATKLGLVVFPISDPDIEPEKFVALTIHEKILY